ncbi:arylesterase [Sulfitobacter litoralis]|uniref:arylesterase n=1 Tax=Sulfitobacter litoralis TaxID=335975 RepID=UPI002B278EB8|nr:arylesterase [Sulfitobacter litoralis]
MMRKVTTALVLVLAGPALAEPLVLAALGDSLTQGYGLPAEDGFVPQLQNWLDQNGADVTVINAGVSGDTTAGGLSRVAWTMTPEVDGMIVTLGGNDLLRGIDPSVSRANLDGILKAAQDAEVEVLLVGMTAPGNFGPEYKTTFDSIYPDLAAQYDATLMGSFFDGLSENGKQPDLAQARGFFQADGVHPNAQGVARIVDALGPKVLTLIDQIHENR